jgi:DNA-binding XRE family transcriptional regulator
MNGAPKQEPAAAPSPASTQASCDEIPAPLPESIVGTTLPPANATPTSVNASPRPAVASPSPDAASTSPATSAPAKPKKKKKRRKPAQQRPNNVRKLRQAAMMSKAELARRASVSPLTINRVENGWPCRMDTKRKILEALGLSPSAREEVFGPDPEAS